MCGYVVCDTGGDLMLSSAALEARFASHIEMQQRPFMQTTAPAACPGTDSRQQPATGSIWTEHPHGAGLSVMPCCLLTLAATSAVAGMAAGHHKAAARSQGQARTSRRELQQGNGEAALALPCTALHRVHCVITQGGMVSRLHPSVCRLTSLSTQR